MSNLCRWKSVDLLMYGLCTVKLISALYKAQIFKIDWFNLSGHTDNGKQLQRNRTETQAENDSLH